MSFAADTPLDIETGVKIVARYDLKIRLRQVRSMTRRKPLERLLRSHADAAIGPSEIPHRDNLDEALAGLGVLHIAGFDTASKLREIGIPPLAVREVLENPWVRRYYEVIYPYAPPILLRAALAEETADYQFELAVERCRPGWEQAFRQFLVVDASFNADGPMECFLSILDDYVIDSVDFGDLKRAFRSDDAMAAFMENDVGQLAIEGIDDFFEFTDDLSDLLARCENYPLFRSLVWLNYGYWYGAGGARMGEVGNWIKSVLPRQNLLEDTQSFDTSDRFEQLHDQMVKLTHFTDFVRPTFEHCPDALGVWAFHVLRQRGALPDAHQ